VFLVKQFASQLCTVEDPTPRRMCRVDTTPLATDRVNAVPLADRLSAERNASHSTVRAATMLLCRVIGPFLSCRGSGSTTNWDDEIGQSPVGATAGC
jgi:hypothetical protein